MIVMMILAMVLQAPVPTPQPAAPTADQTAPAIPQPEGVQLSNTELIAIQGVRSEMDKAGAMASAVEADFKKNHPGFYFDFRAGKAVKESGNPAQKPFTPAKPQPTLNPLKGNTPNLPPVKK